MKPFAQKSNPEPFADLSLLPNKYRLPQLTDALAFLACKVTGKLPAGDHVVYTAEVLDGILQSEEDGRWCASAGTASAIESRPPLRQRPHPG